MNRPKERNVEDMEKINMLTAENKMIQNRLTELEKTLQERKDYEEIKKTLMNAENEVIELNKENEILITEMETKDIELEEALIKVEMFNLEMEENYIDHDQEEDISDFKQAYQKLKKKLKVYFEITSEEKFGMEEKIHGLNNKLQELQSQKANVMDSLEVQQELKKRDNDIAELMKMIDSYKDSQKMIEMMSDKNQKLDDVITKYQHDLTTAKALAEALEEELKESKDYAQELENAMKDLEEEVKLYEEMQIEWEEKELGFEEKLLELTDKIDHLEQERNELETDKFQNQNEKEMYVNYLQDANKKEITQGRDFKDTLLLKYQAKYWHYISVLQKRKLDVIPDKIASKMRLESMDTLDLIEQNDIRLDGSIELLFREYVLKFSLSTESPNLYSNAKDLLLDLLNIKAYLSVCKQKFLGQAANQTEESEGEEPSRFSDSDFFKEVLKNLSNVENLYLILTKGELSANYCMSHFAEAKFKLEEMICTLELSDKLRVLRVLTKGVQQMVAMAVDMGEKLESSKHTLMMDVINKTLKIFHTFDCIDTFQEEHIRKVETYEGILELAS